MKFIKPEKISLADHPDLGEQWVQARIAEDPALLGLGDLVLRDKERPQPSGGRLDFLLQNSETDERYEVELQLGKTNESHIIRTIEYWDIERKRYPQYEHTAVIVAEEINSRFFNVISLFNGTIPLIAIQLQAVRIGDSISLVATTVLGRIERGLEGEDEDVREIKDRPYWEERSPEYLRLADDLLNRAKKHDAEFELKYNKYYIALAKHGGFFNLCTINPRKKFTFVRVVTPPSEDLDGMLDESGFEYQKLRGNRYQVKLTTEQFRTNTDILEQLLKSAYDHQSG
jgi:hypothetical protein